MFQHDDAPRDRLHAYIHLVQSDAQVTKTDATAAIPVNDTDKPRLDDLDELLNWLDLTGFGTSFEDVDHAPPIPAAPQVPLGVTISPGIKLVSVDIWDTVLRRDCYPDEIKLQSARYLFMRASTRLRPDFRNIAVLYSARISAENASAPNDEFEFRFEEALDLWLSTALRSDAPTALRVSLKADLLAHEFAAELRSTRPDASMPVFLRKLQVPVNLRFGLLHLKALHRAIADGS